MSLRYGDGSLATITYLTSMHRRFPKETFEVSSGGRTARLDNFKRSTVWTGPRARVRRPLGSADKGQSAEIKAFLESVRTGGPMPISLDSLAATTRATLAAAGSPCREQRADTRYDTRCHAPEGRRHRSIMNSVELEWRLRRLSKMSASEVRWRISDHVRRKRWASQQVMPEFHPSRGLVHRSARAGQPWDSARVADVSTVSLPESYCGPFRRTPRRGVIARRTRYWRGSGSSSVLCVGTWRTRTGSSIP